MKTITERITNYETPTTCRLHSHTNSFNPHGNILSTVPYLSVFYKRTVRLISGRFSHVTG